MVVDRRTVEEWEARVGEQVRSLRLAANTSAEELARLASVSVGALANLEHGRGSSLRTLVRVLKALDQTAWLDDLDALAGVETPMQALARRRGGPAVRRRASKAEG